MATLATADQPLFEALRACRKAIADRLDLPPYVIFHDATLREMAEHRPRTEADLLGINGVGESKLKRYGKAFLEVIDEEPAELTDEEPAEAVDEEPAEA